LLKFSATPISEKAQLTVGFTDYNRIFYRIKWSFGGRTTSKEMNSEHQHFKGGKYKVTFTVTNAVSSSTTTINYTKVTANTNRDIF